MLLCIGSIAIGHRQPLPSFLPELSQCNGTLCFLGIQAGVTTLDAGNAIIEQASQLTYEAANDYWRIERSATPYLLVRLSKAFGAETIDTINIGYSTPELSVGDIINRFGIPCNIGSSDFEMLLVYPNIAFRSFGSEPFRMRLDSQLKMVVLFDPVSRDSICEPGPVRGGFRWKGFGFYP